MITIKRPMLAAPLLKAGADFSNEGIYAAMKKLKYPVAVTEKKDGIRALRLNGSLVSRTFKQIPNKRIREAATTHLAAGFDMELWSPLLSYNEIESIVMSKEHDDWHRIQFHILDWITEGIDYISRVRQINKWYDAATRDIRIEVPRLYVCHDIDYLFDAFLRSEEDGQEGICFRTLDSPYKQGRSTLREQYLVKLCRSLTLECKVIAVEELMRNGSATNRNSLGLMDRSKLKSEMIPAGVVGALVCVHPQYGTFKVGTGFTDVQRVKMWNAAPTVIGRTITVKYKPHGMKDTLRSPVFVGFRKEGY